MFSRTATVYEPLMKVFLGVRGRSGSTFSILNNLSSETDHSIRSGQLGRVGQTLDHEWKGYLDKTRLRHCGLTFVLRLSRKEFGPCRTIQAFAKLTGHLDAVA